MGLRAVLASEGLRRAVTAAGLALGVRPVPPPPPRLDLELLCAHLHRLNGELARLVRADPSPPALYLRLSAASLAYDAVLRDACSSLGLGEPGPPPFDGAARLEVEAVLSVAGLRW